LARIERGIAFIEAHLFERPSLAAIAERSGASPWHFHRVFVALTGETPATYTWKRQLAEICPRLGAAHAPWHLPGVCVALPGETPATSTWKRQLAEICRRLVETNQPIVELALDA